MLLSRPVTTLVAGALGAALVLSGASAAVAAPAKASVAAPRPPVKAVAVAKADRRVTLARAGLLRRAVAGRRRAGQGGPGGARSDRGARRPTLAAARAAVAQDGRRRCAPRRPPPRPLAQLAVLRSRVPASAPGVLASTAKVVARADAAVAVGGRGRPGRSTEAVGDGGAGELADQVEAARTAAADGRRRP